MKYCELFGALLDPYVDGELSAEEMERVRSHLAICPGCQAYVDDALAIRAGFPALDETELPASFAEAVCAAVRVTPQTKKKTPWVRVLAPLAACLAVVVILQSGPLAGSGGSAAPQAADVAYDTGVPEAAMAADEAVPEESPAAPEAFSVDNGETMPQGAPVQNSVDAKTSARYTGVAPFAELTLTADQAGEALAGFTPAAQEDGTLVYHLTTAEYDTLRTALADSGIQFPEVAAPESEDAFALVTVTP